MGSLCIADGRSRTALPRCLQPIALFAACCVVLSGCGAEQRTEPDPVPPAAVETPAPPPVEVKAKTASELIMEQEAELNRLRREQEGLRAEAAPLVVLEEDYESPVPIVPTRPMFPESPEWEEQPEPEDNAGIEDSGAAEPPRKRSPRSGHQITNDDVDKIWDQMSFHMVQDLLHVDGILLDAYTKGIVDYEVWEWHSEVESEVNVVRIRFIDGRVHSIQRNPGPYMLMR